MLWLEPRSTSSHCGSENALDQRVLVLPSTAADAGNEAFCTDDAVAVSPSGSPQESTRRRKLRSPRARNAAANPITTG
jgi:hypothetical protein